MARTSCLPDKGAFAAAEIAYHPDGRPRAISPGKLPLSDQCQRASETLFSLMVAPVRYVGRAGASDGVLFPLWPRFLECTSGRPEIPVPLTTTAEPPMVMSRVSVRYPRTAHRLWVSGYVTLRVDVAASGCVRGVETERSLHPLVDIEAVRVAVQSDIRPMKVAGQAVASRLLMNIGFDPSQLSAPF
jgi:TonB family protein